MLALSRAIAPRGHMLGIAPGRVVLARSRRSPMSTASSVPSASTPPSTTPPAHVPTHAATHLRDRPKRAHLDRRASAAASPASRLSAFITRRPLAAGASSAAKELPAHASMNPSTTYVQPLTSRQLRLRLGLWGAATVAFFAWALVYAHGQQIRGSPLFKGVMYTLRVDPKVREYIGTGITPAAYIHGFVNHIKGKADIEFDVVGSTGAGHVHLQALRFKEDWYVKDLRVTVAGEELVRIRPGQSHREIADGIGGDVPNIATI